MPETHGPLPGEPKEDRACGGDSNGPVGNRLAAGPARAGRGRRRRPPHRVGRLRLDAQGPGPRRRLREPAGLLRLHVLLRLRQRRRERLGVGAQLDEAAGRPRDRLRRGVTARDGVLRVSPDERSARVGDRRRAARQAPRPRPGPAGDGDPRTRPPDPDPQRRTADRRDDQAGQRLVGHGAGGGLSGPPGLEHAGAGHQRPHGPDRQLHGRQRRRPRGPGGAVAGSEPWPRRRATHEIASRSAGPAPQTATQVAPAGGGTTLVRWKATDPDGKKLTASIDYSTNGRVYRALVTGLHGSSSSPAERTADPLRPRSAAGAGQRRLE